jgi:DNA repair protein RadA/Sms
VEVEDASERFVAAATRAPGSVVLCAMEGSRPLLVEVQALVAPTELVPPRRVANGVDRNRLALVLAVLARHAGVSLASSDVFVSVAGGMRVDEPGADLAIALALVSAAKGIALGGERPLAAFGELGLTGELRHAQHSERRMSEIAKFGLEALAQGDAIGDVRIALKAALKGRAQAKAA